MFLYAAPPLFAMAKELRNHLTPAEKILWCRLKQILPGYKFRRQHPIGNFIADFYCHSAKLVIEVDGPVHNSKEQAEYDQERTFIIEGWGIKVIRFSNEEVETKIESVIDVIRSEIQKFK